MLYGVAMCFSPVRVSFVHLNLDWDQEVISTYQLNKSEVLIASFRTKVWQVWTGELQV